MVIDLVEESKRKKAIIEKCDSAFLDPVTELADFADVFKKIDQYAFFFAAYKGDEVIGYAAMYANNSETKIAYVSLIAVVEEMQRQQIGSSLMEKCIDTAAEAGMTKLRLEVADKNKKAISFYKHFDFAFENRCSDNSCYYIRKIS